MPRTANISISLPVETIRRLRRAARERGSTVSAIVRQTLDGDLRRIEEAALERQIADHFSDPRVRRDEEDLTRIWMQASTLWKESNEHPGRGTRRRLPR